MRGCVDDVGHAIEGRSNAGVLQRSAGADRGINDDRDQCAALAKLEGFGFRLRRLVRFIRRGKRKRVGLRARALYECPRLRDAAHWITTNLGQVVHTGDSYFPINAIPSTIEDLSQWFAEAHGLNQFQLCCQCGCLGEGNGLKFPSNVLHMKIHRVVRHVFEEGYLLGRFPFGGPL